MWLLLLLASSALALRDVEPPLPERSSRANPVEGWLTVRLNHFKASDTNTFRMRYYYNDEFSDGGNVVIFVGGEWEIHPAWTTGGLAHEIAEAIGAGVFYTEHRFYGATRPSSETTLEDLRFLTADQALGDLAQFIQHVKSDDFEGGKYKDGAVALVGCSYAGSVATWMRLGYPHLVQAVFSDSGPLHAQEDFPEYLEVIAEALRSQGSAECLASVEEGMEQLTARLQAGGAQAVSDMFNTCSAIQATPLDLATFSWFGITETFAYLVQYATPGDIPAACAVLTDSTVADPVQRLANWVTAQPWTQPCIESRYSVVLEQHTNTSYDAPQAVMRLWTYQTCVEYGWYQSTSSPRQPFQASVPLEYFHQMCKDFYSSYFDESFLRSGISRTNLFFGGVTHLPDRVVSVAGGLDPWAPMGPNATHATPQAPVYVVPTISHCRAIQSTASSETSELDRAKRAVISHMVEWTTGERSAASGNTGLLALVAVAAALIMNH